MEENKSSNRRSFIRRIIGIGLAGAVAAAIQQTNLPPVNAADGDYMRVGYAMSGSSETYLSSSTANLATFRANNSNTYGTALEGDCGGGSGIGVFGSGGYYGVRGYTGSGPAGISGSGPAIGVWGGDASAASPFGIAYPAGVVGKTGSSNGSGVVGIAENINASGYSSSAGVLGISNNRPAVMADSQNGRGIDAHTWGASEGILGSSLGGVGVRGLSFSSAAGVHGESVGGDGVKGVASNGGIIAAVRGENSSSASSAYGVFGRIAGGPLPPSGEAGAGVRGICPFGPTGQGVVGSGGNGVVGYGVYAGGHFEGAGPNAVGVRGVSAAAAGYSGGSTVAIQSRGDLLPDTDNSRNCGANGVRWALVRGAVVQSGDLLFENGVKATEEGDGLAFHNAKGTKIAVLDAEGNWHIKGDIIRDL